MPAFVKLPGGVIVQNLITGQGDREAQAGDTILLDYVLRRAVRVLNSTAAGTPSLTRALRFARSPEWLFHLLDARGFVVLNSTCALTP